MHGLPRHYVPRNDALISVTASEARQSMHPDVMDRHASLSMNSSVITNPSPVIANEVTQSMHPEVMDRRATLAMTKSLFKGRVRYRAGYGWLAMTKPPR